LSSRPFIEMLRTDKCHPNVDLLNVILSFLSAWGCAIS
jgi:hypothetical protein